MAIDNKADDKKPDFFVTQKGTATDSLKTPGGQVMSDHALDQMSKRGINPSQVDNTISKGEKFDYIQHEGGNSFERTGYYNPDDKTFIVVDKSSQEVKTVYRAERSHIENVKERQG